MNFVRYYTDGSLSPFDMVEWEERIVEIKEDNGNYIFEQDSVEVPVFWESVATSILSNKYFKRARVPSETIPVPEEGIFPKFYRSIPAEGCVFGRENSLKQVAHRLAGTWTYWMIKTGYIKLEEDANVFYDELCYILINQIAAPNSPQFFNTGLGWAYGIEHQDAEYFYFSEKHGRIVHTLEDKDDSICRAAAHACFVSEIKDSMFGEKSIYDTLVSEAKIFRTGSGNGMNVSALRGRGEKLSSGGTSSGVMSFLKIFDRSADAVKSGGACLPGHQMVYTEKGPIPIKTLSDQKNKFVVISYDPPAKRYKAKWAEAWYSGEKEVVRIITDKGQFELSFDHPVKLSDGKMVLAGNLIPGNSLFACHMNKRKDGYARIERRDGFSGKEDWHRMVARDLMGIELDGKIIHHKDGNIYNNHPSNFEIMTQSQHARLHGLGLSKEGKHTFQMIKFDHSGENNGMHKSSKFWKDTNRVHKFKEKQSKILISSCRSTDMQKESIKFKMMNLAYKIINSGYSINEFEEYVYGRKIVIGRIGSIKQLKEKINNNFGNYNNFVKEVYKNNHKVISVENIGIMPVYDIEVECETPDDKSPQSGHNFVIWSTSEISGSGIAVFNTRRSAKMVSLDIDHPEIEEFIDWKVNEEQKVASMLSGSKSNDQILNEIIRCWQELGKNASYKHKKIKNLINLALSHNIEINYIKRAIDIAKQGKNKMEFIQLTNDFNDEAYHTISGQNSNNSICITDNFLNSVKKNSEWNLTNRTDGKIYKTIDANLLWNKLCYSAWLSADPGVHYKDTMNSWNTCLNDGEIHATNPCFTGDTRIATPDGLITIEELVKKSYLGIMTEVYTKGGVVSRPVAYMYTGVNDVYKITLSDGREIKCTENHNWYINGEKIQTKNLKIGMPISLFSDISIKDNKSKLIDNLQNNIQLDSKYFNLNNEYEIIDFDDEKECRLAQKIIDCFNKKTIIIKENNKYKLRNFNNQIVIQSIEYSGKEDTYNLTEPINNLVYANGILISQCSEFVWLDSSACNLASIRLTKFFDEKNGKFDLKQFRHVVHLMTSVLEMTIESALLPTPAIAKGVEDYRTLGLGYTDIGALMMLQGIPYDSDRSRAWIGVLTAILTGESYMTSIEMAKEKIPFNRYEANQEHMIRIIRNHRRATYNSKIDEYEMLNVPPMGIDPNFCPEYLLNYAQKVWDKVLSEGEKYGFRNAQTTLLAPCGTIGLLMSCDTTGIEPDFSLVKHKKLAGGGYIKIVNRMVSKALLKLGYTSEQIDDIEKYIVGHGQLPDFGLDEESLLELMSEEQLANIEDSLPSLSHISQSFNTHTLGREYCIEIGIPEEQLYSMDIGKQILKSMGFTDKEVEQANIYICGNQTIEGAPHVKEEHYPVFDCAVPAGNGNRYIHHNAHIKALAAAQSFLSGASSKTINLFEDATIEDVENCYWLAHDLGVKCVALYRDGCKLSQPLNTLSKSVEFLTDLNQSIEVEEKNIFVAQRRKLPNKRFGQTHEFQIGPFGGPYHKIFLRTGEYEDGTLGEIFIDYAEEDAATRTALGALGRSVSIGLQHGVPQEEYFSMLRSIAQDPSGQVLHPNVKIAKSIYDVIGKIGSYEYDNDVNAVEVSSVEKIEQVKKIYAEEIESVDFSVSNEIIRISSKEKPSLEQCPACGSLDMVKEKSCVLRCKRCNFSSGSCGQ